MAEENIADRVNRLGVEYRTGLIEQMAKVLDNRPTDGEKVGPQRELELWMMPTSPAAVIALKRGATMREAHEANGMWRDLMVKQGAPDELIAQTCAKFAYERGKAHGRGDLERETAWHEKMAERAAPLFADPAYMDSLGAAPGPVYETVGGGSDGGEAGATDEGMVG